ncbi:MAG TPA: hypothetical protein VK047_07145 [Zeimonas sp.]|nr:hypothetical protein [Zeimonas sp.]
MISAEIAELLVRTVATAIFVIGVTAAVGRLGPAIGGALAGLPIVLGPGFFFLARTEEASFVIDAAGYSLLSLCATQLFLLAYVFAAARGATPLRAIARAGGAWIASAAALRLLPPQPWLGLALFAALTALVHRLGAGFRSKVPTDRRDETLGLLLLRGVLAGLLVAVVTAASRRLGTGWSGLILAFPIGYSVIAATVHRRLGAANVVATLHSAMLATVGLAGFCAALAFALAVWPAGPALAAAFAVSFAITAALVIVRMRSSSVARRNGSVAR